MAGQPKKRAMIAELSKRALEECGDAEAHLEYVVDWVKGGKTLVELASDLSVSLHMRIVIDGSIFEDITARMVTKHLNTKYPETAGALLAAARREGAHGMVAQAMQIADEVPADREQIAKAKLRVDTRLWAAERWNRDELGKAPEVALQLNINALHLDAMRVQRIPAKESAESAASIAGARAFIIPSSDPASRKELLDNVSTIDSTIDLASDEVIALPTMELA
jgi:hypothetical protein